MGKILREQERRVTLGENPVQSDINFHQLLARATRNKVLERFQLALSGFLRKTRQAYHQSEERKQRSLRGHQNILVAIKSGNGRAARQAMRRHLEDVERILFNKERGVGKVL